MTLDIRGSLKNTKINQNIYVMFDELLSNAIDSYLIRINGDSLVGGLNVKFYVELFDEGLYGDCVNFKVICTDNGAGFNDDQTKAFVTKDSSFKDDLGIEGIGKCRGSGRIQFFHYFSKIEIESVYGREGNYKKRQLRFRDGTKEIDVNSFSQNDAHEKEIKTEITLDNIKPNIYKKLFLGKNLRELFSAETLKSYILVNFLQRFVSLRVGLGQFTIGFEIKYKDQQEKAFLSPSDLPEITVKEEVRVCYRDASGTELAEDEKFTISQYKLSSQKYKLPRNTVALCAKSSIVKPITSQYLKTKGLENNPINDFNHIILIESDYLDKHTNEHRDDFDIPINSQNSDLFFENLIPFEDIYRSIDSTISEMLAPPDWNKEKIVEKIGGKYGISSGMMAAANIRIHYGDTEESVVKRVLSSYQEQIIKDTSEIFDIKSEIISTDPLSDKFREKISDLAWKFTSSLKSIDMANLSQLIVRRATIIEVLRMAIEKRLTIQNGNDKEKREDEKIIHSIFFPMSKDSQEVTDHDIWLLSEEYNYYAYVASDKPLSKISWDGSQLLFENGVDADMQKILEKNYNANSRKRPDIALFNKEGSAIIIEFKAPGVTMDDHVGDLMEYSQLLAAKSNGKLKKFYGYLIGTHVNANRLVGYTRFPNGKGWFGTQNVVEHSTDKKLGELYSEILNYEDIVDRACKRLEVYKKRLNVDFS